VPPDQFFDYLLRFDRYHARYTELNAADFQPISAQKLYANFKGYWFWLPTEQKKPEIALEERTPLSGKVEQYYRKIIELCQARGIPLEIAIAPYVLSNQEQAKFNTAGDIADGYGIPFTNYNLSYDELGFDFSVDMFDNGHLSYKGAEKLTRALGEKLTAQYDLPDRRGDPAYDSWAQNARMYYRQAEGAQLAEMENFNEYWATISADSDMTLCVAVDGKGGEQASAMLARLGVSANIKQGVWAFRNGICIADEASLGERPYMDMGSVTVDLSDPAAVLLNNAAVGTASGGVLLLAYDAVTDAVVDQTGIAGWMEEGEGAPETERIVRLKR
jgi:hypothetical protein